MIDLTCFKAYDIRGEIGVNIDEDMAYRIGRATAQHLKAKTVVIGFDARETSPAFAAAAARGVMDAGSDVLNIGMAGTEEMYWAVTEFGACAGIGALTCAVPTPNHWCALILKHAVGLKALN